VKKQSRRPKAYAAGQPRGGVFIDACGKACGEYLFGIRIIPIHHRFETMCYNVQQPQLIARKCFIINRKSHVGT
jgi:hypothetical protein